MSEPLKIDLPKTTPTEQWVNLDNLPTKVKQKKDLFDLDGNGIVESKNTKGINEVELLKPIFKEMGLNLTNYTQKRWMSRSNNMTTIIGEDRNSDGSYTRFRRKCTADIAKGENTKIISKECEGKASIKNYDDIYYMHYDKNGNQTGITHQQVINGKITSY